MENDAVHEVGVMHFMWRRFNWVQMFAYMGGRLPVERGAPDLRRSMNAIINTYSYDTVLPSRIHIA